MVKADQLACPSHVYCEAWTAHLGFLRFGPEGSWSPNRPGLAGFVGKRCAARACGGKHVRIETDHTHQFGWKVRMARPRRLLYFTTVRFIFPLSGCWLGFSRQVRR